MPRVLVIEDDEAMAVALRDGFAYEGYDVRTAADGVEGLRLASDGQHDLVILDVMLPKVNGLDVCRKIRRNGVSVPIIMLTARGQEIDKVLGLKTGADDYVTKPFSFLELMARVEAVLRRSAAFPGGLERYRFGDVEIDFQRTEASKSGHMLTLSPREFKLMHFLIEHRGEVLPRERLLDAVWGYDEAPLTRTVDMHVAKLRKKIEDRPDHPAWIVTVHRVGYKFTG
jgi:two-component system alkaline phosphatase synthesis response regulator PhoP